MFQSDLRCYVAIFNTHILKWHIQKTNSKCYSSSALRCFSGPKVFISSSHFNDFEIRMHLTIDVISCYNWQKIFCLHAIVDKFMTSFTHDSALDLMNCNYLYFGNTLCRYMHCICKRLYQPYLSYQIINLCF